MLSTLLRLSLWVIAATPVGDTQSTAAVKRLSRFTHALRVITARGVSAKKASGAFTWDADVCLNWVIVIVWHVRAYLNRVAMAASVDASASGLIKACAKPVRDTVAAPHWLRGQHCALTNDGLSPL